MYLRSMFGGEFLANIYERLLMKKLLLLSLVMGSAVAQQAPEQTKVIIIPSYKNNDYYERNLDLVFQKKVVAKIADSATLTARLSKEGFDHLMEKTRIVKYLAGKELETCIILSSIEQALFEYNKCSPAMAAAIAAFSKRRLIQSILQDNQESLKECEVLGAFKPCATIATVEQALKKEGHPVQMLSMEQLEEKKD